MISPALLILPTLLSAPWDVSGDGLRTGVRAPAFNLPRLTQGKVDSTEAFKDHVGILVIGSTEAAAPACRAWMLKLDKRYKENHDVVLFQVAVLNSSWFVPHFAVKAKLRDYVPKHGYSRVLLEWGLEFARKYHIQKTEFPRVVVIDRTGIIRLWHEGAMTEASFARVIKRVKVLTR